MSDSVVSPRTLGLAAALLGILAQGVQADDLVSPLELAQPNFFGLGIGGHPDYLGSDENALGVAPTGRVSFGGNRFARLVVNDICA